MKSVAALRGVIDLTGIEGRQQGRVFHEALERAGAQAEPIYVPAENHISGMISIVRPADPASALLVRLIRSLENQ